MSLSKSIHYSTSRSRVKALHISVRKLFLLITVFAFFFTQFFAQLFPHFLLQAATEESGSVTVNATVLQSDVDGPTTPILISPNNGSYVTVNKPSFVWKRSTDPSGIGHYNFVLDGSDYFTSIPTSATDNSQYTLTYNAISEEYTLTPKTALSEGSHTWKIRAVDTLGYGTDSATWSFTIDSQAPSFVLSAIGDASVSISAQDAGTIPSSPIILQDNEPLLVATGENNSTVQLTVTIPGDPTQNYSKSISSTGNWDQQLGILPRNTVITLDFIITDQAGNISILNGVEFLIESAVIIFPPPSPSPSPSQLPTPSPSPTPGATPILTTSPTPSPSAFPSPSPVGSPIVIPIIPPREIAYDVIQEIGERIPAPIRALTRVVPEGVRRQVARTAPYSAALISAAIPVATAVAIASQFGGNLSLMIILRLLQALGLIPGGKPQGLVFDSESYDPIPFALLTIEGKEDVTSLLHETVVTDVNGVYRGIKLPPGKYSLMVSHQDYRFPTKKQRPNYIPVKDYYQGEVFTVASEKQAQLFLIPVDPLEGVTSKSVKSSFRVKLALLSNITSVLVMPMFVISGVLALIFSSIWNWAVFIIYTVLMIYKAIDWFKVPRITGVVIDTQGNPIANAVIRISSTEGNQLVAVISSNDDGEFSFFGAKEKYQVSITKPGYVWVTDKQATLSLYEADTVTENVNIIATLQDAKAIYSELFG